MTVEPFRHRDHERTIHFGRGSIDRAPEILPGRFTLLSTDRAVKQAGDVAPAADRTVIVPAGPIPELAANILDQLTADGALVALGGGRVIDTAKAVSAATGAGPVIAIPTSLSAAEMTGTHRHATGIPESTPRVRAAIVINDPAVSASQPIELLAASTGNALGHAITALTIDRSTPITQIIATEAAVRLGGAWPGPEPDRDALALGALLAGWALDHSGLGPHHALSQTAVREAKLSHARANTALLPFTVAALRRRYPERLAALDSSLGHPVEAIAGKIHELAGRPHLGTLTCDPDLLELTIGIAAGRPELRNATPPFSHDEVEAIYRSAGG